MLRSNFTERTPAKKTLKEAQQDLDLVLHAGNIGLWIFNLETNSVYFSPEWKNHLGYQDHEIPNRFQEWEARLHPEDRESILNILKAYTEGRRPDFDVEF